MSSKLERYGYKPKKYGLSDQNEPGVDYLITSNIRNYPDMYYVYEKFGQIFDIDPKRLMLGNGCENIIKNVLLALKPKSLGYHIPNWGMLPVFCSALDIEPMELEYHYDSSSKSFYANNLTDKEPFNCYYTNYGITPWFPYIAENTMPFKGYTIVDLTYQPLSVSKAIIGALKHYDTVIIVASLGKIFGAGARLGYAIFPEHLKQKMDLQREQYINMAACQLILENSFECGPYNPYFNKLEEFLKNNEILNQNGVWLTNNYMTIDKLVENQLNAKTFVVDNHEFMKLGIPSSQTELDCLIQVLYRGGYIGNNKE